LPSANGNMSSLERLDIWECQLSGPIPQEVGALKKLTSPVLSSTSLSGRIPSSIANLTQLTELWLDSNDLSGKVSSLVKLHLVSMKTHSILLVTLKICSFFCL
ncbi:hypothetical protein BAE44_0019776, partial [Dichanthelium oligosanthes]